MVALQSIGFERIVTFANCHTKVDSMSSPQEDACLLLTWKGLGMPFEVCLLLARTYTDIHAHIQHRFKFNCFHCSTRYKLELTMSNVKLDHTGLRPTSVRSCRAVPGTCCWPHQAHAKPRLLRAARCSATSSPNSRLAQSVAGKGVRPL